MAKAKKAKKKAVFDYEIKVRIKNGVLKYTDENQKVRSGYHVQWDCPYDYAIQFANDQSPFTPKKTFVSAAASEPPKKYKVKPHTGPRLEHKYSIAVFRGGNYPVLTDDPQVIIDNSGGVGGHEPTKKKVPKKTTSKKKAAKK